MPYDGNPAISLGVQPPQINSPLQTYTGLLQLKELMQGMQLKNAQIQQSQAQAQDIQAQAQQRQRDLADNAVVQNTQTDPDFHTAYGKAGATGDITPIAQYFQGKGTPIQNSTAARLATEAQGIAKNAQGLSDKEMEEQEKDASRVKDAIVGVAGIEDPTDRANALKTALQGIVAQPAWKKSSDILNPVIAGMNPGNTDQITEGLSNFFNKRDAVVQQVAITKEAQSKQLEQAAKTTKAQAEAQTGQQGLAATELGGVQDQAGLDTIRAKYPTVAGQIPATFDPQAIQQARTNLGVPIEKQPEYQISSFEANALKRMATDPKALADTVSQTVDPTKNPQLYQETLKSAQSQLDLGNLAGAKKIIEDAGNTVTSRSSETIKAKAAQEGANAQATIPADVSKAVQVQAAIAKNSPDPFASINNPQARSEAMQNALKISNEYQNDKDTSNKIASNVDLALSGNREAPAIVPLELLRGLVTRVNRWELQSVKGAGSAYDNVAGWLGKATEGQPIPANILQDIKTVNQAAQSIDTQKMHGKIDTLNTLTGAKVPYYDTHSSPTSTGGIPDDVTKALSTVGPGIHTYKADDGTVTKWMKSLNGTITPQ